MGFYFKKTLLILLMIFSFFIGRESDRIKRFFFPEERSPANLALTIEEKERISRSDSPSIAKSIESACNKGKDLKYCSLLNETKSKVESIGKEYSAQIQEYIGKEASIVSLFLLKSIIENKIEIETRSSLGNAQFIVKDGETFLFWKIKKDF